MTDLEKLVEEKGLNKKAYISHVWTSSRTGEQPLSALIAETLQSANEKGYKGTPSIQYSSTFDAGNNAVIFSALIIVHRN